MKTLQHIRMLLLDKACIPQEKQSRFFKTGVGEYAEHDKFLGVKVPDIRVLSRQYRDLALPDLHMLITSEFNEERLLALLILVARYKKADIQLQEELFQWYMHNRMNINNWNLVDSSAHYIVGAYLSNRDRKILLDLAQSESVWERRIAIVATWYFIRNNDLEWTFIIAQSLMNDTHDLIHKAVGWMLREAGKKDVNMLISFLHNYASRLPRTSVRYATERLSLEQKNHFLQRI